MAHRFRGERTLMRIFIGENDRVESGPYKGKPLYEGLLLTLREREFAEAARALGFSRTRIMFRHLLPNALGPIIVAASLGVADAIISESGLSFLGLGIQPPTATWGNMLKNALDQIFAAPWTAIIPGFMIFLTVLSINYIGDGLRDAFDPHKIL